MRTIKPKPRLSRTDAILNRISPKVAAIIGAVIVLSLVGLMIYLITSHERDVKLRDIQIKTMTTEREEAIKDLETMKIDFKKMEMDKSKSQVELDKAKEVIEQKERELKEKDAALQAKAEAKRQEAERIAAAAKLQAHSATAAAASPGGSNEQFTWNFLNSHGFTRAQTAGIMGNLRQEHNYHTSDVPGGLGIAQWMGGRRANLLARENPFQIQTQLQFLIDELNGPESAAGAAIKSAGSVEAATIAFQNKFERCGTCHQERRIEYAYDVLRRY